MLKENFSIDTVVFLKFKSCFTNNFAFHNIKVKQSTRENAFKFLIYTFRSSLCFLQAQVLCMENVFTNLFYHQGINFFWNPITYKYSLVGITVIAIIQQQNLKDPIKMCNTLNL